MAELDLDAQLAEEFDRQEKLPAGYSQPRRTLERALPQDDLQREFDRQEGLSTQAQAAKVTAPQRFDINAPADESNSRAMMAPPERGVAVNPVAERRPGGLMSALRSGWDSGNASAPLADDLEDESGPVGRAIIGAGRMAGRTLGLAGKVVKPAVQDLIELPAQVMGYQEPTRNLKSLEKTRSLLDVIGGTEKQPGPTPFDAQTAQSGPVQRFLRTAVSAVAETTPQLAAGYGLGAAGVPAAVSAGLPMLVTPDGNYDPLGATIAAGLPGVTHLGEMAMAKILGSAPVTKVVLTALSDDPLKLKAKLVQNLAFGVEVSNDQFRKFLEAGGGFMAANAYLLAAKSPEIAALAPDQRAQAVLDMVAQNLAPALLGFIRPGLSKTLEAKAPEIAPELAEIVQGLRESARSKQQKGKSNATNTEQQPSGVPEQPQGTAPVQKTEQGAGAGDSVPGAAGQPAQAKPGRPVAVAPAPEAQGQPAVSPAPTVPELPATIDAQLQMLQDGKRNVVMITPGESVPEVPEGMAKLPMPAGTFIFNPIEVHPDDIRAALKNNTLGTLLGYGIAAKPAKGTEIGAIVVRAPDGTEKQGVLTDAEHLASVTDAANAVKSPGDRVNIESEAGVIAKRSGPEIKVVQSTAREINMGAQQFRSVASGNPDGGGFLSVVAAGSTEQEARDNALQAWGRKVAERGVTQAGMKSDGVTEPNPSAAQIEAGNAPKRKVSLHGLQISIENEAGSMRRSKPGQPPWEVKMPVAYGYIKGTVDRTGEQVDAYLGNNPASKAVWVIDQVIPETGKYDEPKVMIGFSNMAEARASFVASFSDGKGEQRIGAMTGMTISQFKQLLKSPAIKKPVGYKEQSTAAAMKFEKETGWTFKPNGAVSTEGMPPEMAAKIQRLWEFTDRREDSVTRSVTFYVPESASYEQIHAAYEKKLAEVLPSAKPNPAGKLTYEDFALQYESAFKQANKYSIDQLGSRVWTEKMSKLADDYPEFLERLEAEQSSNKTATVEKPAEKPTIKEPDVNEPTESGGGDSGTGRTEPAIAGRTGPQRRPAAPVAGPSGEVQPGTGSPDEGVVTGGRRAGGGKTSAAAVGLASEQEPAAAEPGAGQSRAGGAKGIRPKPAPADPASPAEVGPPGPKNIRLKSNPAPTGPLARVNANIAAIVLVKKLEAEKRQPTDEERAKLAQWSGWGSFKEVFNEGKAERRRYDEGWEKRYGKAFDQLKSLLTQAEFDAAAESSVNAHYTSMEVVHSMWETAKRLGYKAGRSLESSAGSGVVIGYMPEELAGKTRWTAIEMEPITGKILGYLYPEADVRVQPFENAKLPNAHYDLAITNVPFHETGPGKEYPDLNLHNYFIARMLDKVKPGGLVIAITTKGTMDNRPEQRKLLVEKGQLIGAIRLPNNAFRDSAGTEVVTDILVLRKPDGKPFDAEKWLATSEIETKDGPAKINEYFVKHPEMVLGRHALTGSMYGKNEYTVEGKGELGSQLASAIARLPENIVQQNEAPDEHVPELTTLEEFSLVVDAKGNVLESRNFKLEKPSWDSSKKTLVDRARDYVGLRDLLLDQYRLERDKEAKDSDLSANRKKLKAKFDAWVKAHGTLNLNDRRTNYLSSDPSYYTVMGLENVREEQDPKDPTKTVTVITPADVLAKRVIQPDVAPSKTEGAVDALGVSMSYRGNLDMDYVRQLTGLSDEQIEAELIAANQAFKDPDSGRLLPSSEYLTGDVRDKLAKATFAAKESPTFQRNVEALKSVIPATVPFERIAVDITARWVPTGVLNRFARQVMGLPETVVRFVPTVEEFAVAAVSRLSELAQTQWSTTRMPSDQLLQHALNFKRADVRDWTNDNPPKSVRNEADTALANEFIDKIKSEYARWIRSTEETLQYRHFDEKRGEYVTEDLPIWDIMEREYNRKSNSFVVPDFDGSMLKLPGLSAAVRRTPHLLNGVMRAIAGGQAVFAHGVGSGKTFLFIVASRELQRIGLAKKAVLVVKKPTVGQYRMSIERAYPGSKVLIPSKKDFESSNRKKMIARIASTRWDFIVLTHEQFRSVRPGDDLVQAFFNDQIEQLRQILREQGEESAEGAKSTRGMDPSVRSIVRKIKSLKKRLDKHLTSIGKNQDLGSNWENLGIDALFVDESHNFKKMPIATQMEGEVKGIPSEFSQRAVDLLIKVRDVQRRTDGRNIFFGSGTPVSNTLAELWIQFYASNPKLIKDFGLQTFDSFASTFADVVSNFELGWDNQFKNVTRMSRFKNPSGLTTLTRMGMDVKMGNKELGLDVPEMEGGKPSVNVIKATPAFNKWLELLSDITTAWEGLDPKGRFLNSWVPIATMRAGVAAALDPRCVFPEAPDDPKSKVNTAVRLIMQEWERGKADRTTMMVFADMYRTLNSEKLRDFLGHGAVEVPTEIEGEPAKEEEETDAASQDEAAFEQQAVGAFNLYSDIRAKLARLGVPEHEIGIITEHDTDAKRETLFNKVRTGAVRILIGSTEKIGEGVDVPQRMSAQFHLDPPMQMTPAKMEQRIGRIIRQGNMFSVKNLNKPVRVYLFAQERSMDAAIYQMLETKGTMVIQALKGQYLGDSFEDPASELTMAMAEMKAAATGDNRVLQMAKLQKDVRDLNLAEGAYLRRNSELRRLTEDEKRAAKSDAASAKRFTDLQALVSPIVEDKENISVLHVKTQKRIEGEEAVKSWLKSMAPTLDKAIKEPNTAVNMSLIIGEKLRVLYEAKHKLVELYGGGTRDEFGHSATFYIGGPEPSWADARWDSSLSSVETLLQALYGIPGRAEKKAGDYTASAEKHTRLAEAYAKQLSEQVFDKADELKQKQAALSELESQLRPAPKAPPAAAPTTTTQASLAEASDGQPAEPAEAIEARSVEELRAMLPYMGLPAQSEAMLREFLNLPLIDKLPAFRTMIADALEGGFQGSKLHDLVGIARSADPKTGPHELLHVAWDILPDELKAELERMRVAALDDLIREAQEAGRPETEQALTEIRDNPTLGGEDFLSRNFPVTLRARLYAYSSAEEFFAHSGSQRFEQRVGSVVEGFWERLKGIVRDIISAIKKALKLRPNQREFLDGILSGEFEPATAEDVAAKERQASISPEDFLDLSPEEQESVLSGERERARTRTRVLGDNYWVFDRERITPESIEASSAVAKQVFDDVGIPVVEQESPKGDLFPNRRAWIAPPQGRDMSAEGGKLIERLKQELAAKDSPENSADRLANLINSIRINALVLPDTAFGEMSPGVRMELGRIAQSDASYRGAALGALAGYRKDLAFVGRNLDVELGRIWSDAFGGEDLLDLLEQLKKAKSDNKDLKEALDEALNKLGGRLTRSMGPGTRLGGKIIALVRDGDGDAWNMLREIAKIRGWNVPSDEDLQRIKDLLDREESLTQLTPEEHASAKGDEAVINRLLDDRRLATQEKRNALLKQVRLAITRWTRPLNWRKYWATPANNASALNEYAIGNMLFKVGFAIPRLPVHIMGQLLMVHVPSRAIGTALANAESLKARKLDFSLWKITHQALHDQISGSIGAWRQSMRAFTAALAGRAETRNADRLNNGIMLFERMAAKAREYAERGDWGRAAAVWLIHLPKYSLRFVQAVDNMQGQPTELAEMRHQARQFMREDGRNPAEIEQAMGAIFDGMSEKRERAMADARGILEASGLTFTQRELIETAWNLVKGRMYQDMQAIGLPSDDFHARNQHLMQTLAWQLPAQHGLGGVLSQTMKSVRGFFQAHGVPTPLLGFGNAIGTGVNYMLMNTPLYGTAAWRIPGVSRGESPWFLTPEDRWQRRVQALLWSMLGFLIFAAVRMGLIKVWNHAPRDKEERALFDAQGHRAGTWEIRVSDHEFIPLSMVVGPGALLAPYLASAGALQDAMDARAKRQAKMNAEAEKRGLTPGKIEPMGSSDILAVIGQGAWGALMGNKALAGKIDSGSEFGLPNIKKLAAAQVSPYAVGLPGYQEISRAMGVVLDPKTATFADYLVPLPTSGARAVNFLGQPVGTPDDLQRVIQTMTAGTYPGIVDSDQAKKNVAYAALISSGYRPPTIDPNKAYAIDGEYRRLTSAELETYSTERGRYLAQELADLGPEATAKDAAGAYSRANRQALGEIGVSTPATTGRSSGQVPAEVGAGGAGAPGVGGYSGRNAPRAFTAGSRLRGARSPRAFGHVRALPRVARPPRGATLGRVGRGLRLSAAGPRRGLLR